MLEACMDVDHRGLYQGSMAMVLMRTLKIWAGCMHIGPAMLLESVKKVKNVSLETAGHHPVYY